MADSKETSDPASAPPAVTMNVTAVEERVHVDVAQQETATVRVRTQVTQTGIARK